jgi:hypothetical protein
MNERIDTLDELLSDPMVQLVMARDRVKPDEVRLHFKRARARARQPLVPPAHVVDKRCWTQRPCL